MKPRTGKAVSVPTGLFFSLLTSIFITITVIAIIAILLLQNKITWKETGYWIMAMLLISSFAGSRMAIETIKTQRYLVSFMAGTVYWMILFCIAALFFGGNYSSVLETDALIISGSITAALLHIPQKHRTYAKRRRSYR